MKLTDARRDFYRKLAKDDGFRSRSAYKLLQLNKSYHFLKNGDKVVDFGSYPGGWLQVARDRVGHKGLVIGTDLKQIDPLEGVICLNYSIEDPDLQVYLTGRIGRIDVVLSDLSPNISGMWEIDHFTQINLSRMAFNLSSVLLRRNGSAIYKVFDGDTLIEFVKEVSTRFHRVKISKPAASRQSSSESYLVCSGFREQN
jgi:23S rRNA (uridine2552-2'-O)-methyltransferase